MGGKAGECSLTAPFGGVQSRVRHVEGFVECAGKRVETDPDARTVGINHIVPDDAPVLGSQVILDSGVPLVLVPCMSVASYLSVTGPELEYHIKDKSKVGTYLCETVTSQMSQEMAQNWLDLFHQTYCAGLDDYGDEGAPKTDSMLSPSRIIWDISTVGYVVNPNWCPSTLVPTPRLTQDLKWEQDETRHEMRLVRFIYRDALLGDMFSKLQKAPK